MGDLYYMTIRSFRPRCPSCNRVGFDESGVCPHCGESECPNCRKWSRAARDSRECPYCGGWNSIEEKIQGWGCIFFIVLFLICFVLGLAERCDRDPWPSGLEPPDASDY